uniref:Insertion element IS402-like domain-containing protein n=1 Tax=Eubacterium plexicaudatum ASF492 TaxID=1235802 RepID=N2BBJ6_9FIRM
MDDPWSIRQNDLDCPIYNLTDNQILSFIFGTGLLNAMVWMAKSGAPRDLPEYYGPWKSVYSRFRKWLDCGILKEIFKKLSLGAELSEISIDVSIVRIHQHSAGVPKKWACE